jgi:ABC-type antimicrobial peptide transport system permease subunit
MNKKTRAKIGLIGSLIICLFGVYRLLVEFPIDISLVAVPLAFAVSGFIGVITNLKTLKKIE